jgi:lipopolysaccharide/colanic/teichoic acid biosynthesis glycosyltransferase
MHTVDPSSGPSFPCTELSASDRGGCRDFALQADAEAASSQFGNRTKTCDPPLAACENNAKTGTNTETAFITVPMEIPSWKRILDITCILLSLPVLLPVVALVTLWIKLVSPGPIFFRQERVGYRERRFMMSKFRTMKVNIETQSHERHMEQLIAADRPMTKLDASGDPRIIPGGRIIRAMGLDELPQLFDVFRGEMSLVGPRPCTPHEFARYQVWQRERFNAAPGLTGFWQVNGKNKTTFTEMMKMDIFYTRNMSLRLDLTIMFRTLPTILAQAIEAYIGARFRVGNTSPVEGEEQTCR